MILIDTSKQLGEDSILKLVIKFSIPAIVGMLINAIYNVVDRMFIGKFVGADAFAGVTVLYPYTLIVLGFSMLIGIGATSLISIKLGEHKKDEAENVMGNAFVLLTIVSLLLSIFTFIFKKDILYLFGASENTIQPALDYLNVLLIGFPVQLIGFGMNNFIRSEGKPNIAMATMFIGAILNVVLDAILIISFDMGTKGAAIATVVSQAVSAVWVLSYFFSKKSLLKLRSKYFKLVPSIITKIVSLGLPQFFIQIANSVIAILINRTLSIYGGDIAISAYGVINSLSIFILMPIFGINQGSQPILGYNFGARKYNRVQDTLKISMAIATAIAAVGFIATQFFSDSLVRFFSNDKDVIIMASRGLKIFFFMFPLVGAQIVGANFFQATGNSRNAILLSLSRQVLILIPLLLIFPKFFGLDGVWYASPVSDFFSAIITGSVLYIYLKGMSRKKS